MHTRKRMAAAAAALATVLVIAGCSSDTGESTSSTAEGVTIQHAFGETVVPNDVENVVTLGWGSTDAAIALGVVPVAIPFDGYAGDEEGVLPWVREAVDEMGAELPTILPNDAEEPPYAEIDAADPDVILAVYSGITQEQYDLLSEIAPVVAYSGEAWSTPWRELISTVGTALGKEDEATTVIADIEDQVATLAAAHPEFAGKTIAAVWDTGTFYVYKPADPRVEFLLDLGFVNAPAVDELANGDATFYYTLSYEELDKLSSDVLLTYHANDAEAAAFLASPQASVIPAVQAGAVAQVIGVEYISAVSPPTALSIPWGLENLVSALAAAVNPV